MDIGSLRHRIELQSPTETENGMGGATTTYATSYTVWAEFRNWQIAKEMIKGQHATMEISHQVRIRYITGDPIKPNWRVKYGNRYFNIVSIMNMNFENKWVILMLKETL